MCGGNDIGGDDEVLVVVMVLIVVIMIMVIDVVKVVMVVFVVVLVRAGNSGGTWEPVVQRNKFILQNFCSFEIFKKLNSKLVPTFLYKNFFLYRLQ